jgi:hypothetical protein
MINFAVLIPVGLAAHMMQEFCEIQACTRKLKKAKLSFRIIIY